jgi:hypothetical protein
VSYATIAEIAAAETINESYVGRVLRLTLLAPRHRLSPQGEYCRIFDAVLVSLIGSWPGMLMGCPSFSRSRFATYSN